MRILPYTLLRLLLLALLALALVRGAGAERGRAAAFVSPPPPAQAGEWLARVSRADEAIIVRTAESAPTPAELASLDAAAALGRPVLAALPDAPPPLTAFQPPLLRVERAAALPFRLAGEPRAEPRVLLSDAAGELDSTRITLDSAGTAAAAFRIQPVKEGWHEWVLRADGDSARVGAWALPAEAPRVLIAAGAPTWEARFLARALEESRAEVSLAQPLGGALTLGGEAAGLPASAAGLAGFDVVIVTADAEVDAAAAAALQNFAAAGGGVVIAGHPGTIAALGIASPGTARRFAPADSAAVTWQAPAEISPLPRAAIAATVLPLRDARPGAVAAAHAADAPVLLLAPAGAGRIAAVGLGETWRWRMEAGQVEAHRAFWKSLVEWAAAGDSIRATVASSIVSPGTLVRAPVTASMLSPPALTLRRPDGTTETLPRDTARDGMAVRFVAADTGVHTIVSGGRVLVAVRAHPDAPPRADAWAALARRMQASGGAAVARDSLAAAESAWRAARWGRTVPDSWLFAAIVVVACAEWTWRRTRGRQ